MEIPAIPYTPFDSGFASPPLQRFIPAYPNGVVPQWLVKKVPRGSWLIDPLGANPLPAIQAAKAGYRILVARSNPILRLMLEVLSGALKEEQFRSALTSLMITKIGDEQLAAHLQALYQTQCAGCNQLVSVRGFIWEKNHDQPKRCIYACPQCGEKGEFLITAFDLEKLAHIDQQRNKFRARAKQRVVLGLEKGTFGLDEALNCYPNRSLYFIITLINKLEGLSLAPQQKSLLMALLLNVMDLGNNLWHWPAKPYRPLTLNTPAEFFEHNLWVALQEAIRFWTIFDAPVAVTRWPELPSEAGGICLYQRSKTNPSEIIERARPQAMITIFPRPNQAFLTFTVLWSGWLWGAQAVQQMHSALENRRYDWRWLAGSLQLGLQHMDAILPGSALAFGLACEPTPANLFSILAATKQNSLHLNGLSFRQAEHTFQLEWSHQAETEEVQICSIQDIYPEAIQGLIRKKGEPINYEEALYACRLAHAITANLPQNLLELKEDYQDQELIQIKNLLQDSSFLITYKNQYAPQGNQWWLAQPSGIDAPLSDRVEDAILNTLQKKETITLAELDQDICQRFNGLCTPSLELVKTILESYTEPLPESGGMFKLRQEDESANRQVEIIKSIDILKDLVVIFGYRIEGENPLIWLDKDGKLIQIFFVLGTSVLNSILNLEELPSPHNCLFVIPGSRSRLVLYKLKGNAYLQEKINLGWRFLKMHHLRKLAQRYDLTPALWENLLNADPLMWDSPSQLQIL